MFLQIPFRAPLIHVLIYLQLIDHARARLCWAPRAPDSLWDVCLCDGYRIRFREVAVPLSTAVMSWSVWSQWWDCIYMYMKRDRKGCNSCYGYSPLVGKYYVRTIMQNKKLQLFESQNGTMLSAVLNIHHKQAHVKTQNSFINQCWQATKSIPRHSDLSDTWYFKLWLDKLKNLPWQRTETARACCVSCVFTMSSRWCSSLNIFLKSCEVYAYSLVHQCHLVSRLLPQHCVPAFCLS